MKIFRLCLLLLLAVLLPVRGALAVGMQCSGPVSPAQQSERGHHAWGGGVDHHDMHAHGHPDDPADEPAGAIDKCNLCAASCAATALVGASVTLAEPQRGSAVFPLLHAPPPNFVSDGQERPPRTT